MRNTPLILAAAVALAFPLAAKAADMHMPVFKAAPCMGCDWNGFYAGVSIGKGWASSTTTETWNWVTNYPAGTPIGVGGGPLIATPVPASYSTTFSDQYHHNAAGILGGLQAGYNWQIGRVVLGIEGDWSWSNQKESVTYSAMPIAGQFPPLPNFFFVPLTSQGWTSEEKLDWITTVRGRLGWAQGANLWYMTGGVAWARIESKYTLVSSPGNTGLPVAGGGVGPGTFAQWGLPGGSQAANFSTVKTGWALGGGLETAVGELLGLGGGNRWTMKLEYLYVDLGHLDYQFGTNLVPVCATTCTNPATGTASFSSRNHVYEQVIRVGLNYKFNALAAPPVYK